MTFQGCARDLCNHLQTNISNRLGFWQRRKCLLVFGIFVFWYLSRLSHLLETTLLRDHALSNQRLQTKDPVSCFSHPRIGQKWFLIKVFEVPSIPPPLKPFSLHRWGLPYSSASRPITPQWANCMWPSSTIWTRNLWHYCQAESSQVWGIEPAEHWDQLRYNYRHQEKMICQEKKQGGPCELHYGCSIFRPGFLHVPIVGSWLIRQWACPGRNCLLIVSRV